MKEKIAIVTDTNSGITPKQAAEYGIYMVAMPVIINDETYFENESIFQDEFFKLLREGANVSTSMPSPGTLIDCWEGLLERYEEIIYLPMSSGLSGSCSTATMIAEEYGGSVHVVDNHRISVTLRQSVLEAKQMASQEKSAREIVEYLERDSLESDIYVAVNTLEYLKKSGRVTPAGAAISTILNIKPILQIQGGKLDAYKKVRGMRQAMQTMIDALKQDLITRFAEQKMTIRAAYSGDAKVGAAWQKELQNAFPEMTIGLDPLPISIACHTGDGALGVGIMKDIL
ncbi:MAG: DegV family protein [Oscillospiraceae bacterium]